jgi:polar amino acid transport system substrate-binding protein
MKTRIVCASLVCLLICFGLGAAYANAARLEQAQPRPLRVAISQIMPFAFKQGDVWTGFSVDLWDAAARRLGVAYEWVEVKSDEEQLQAVQSGDADVAIAAISMTPERERMVDFSLPYFDSGLQVAVRVQPNRPVLNALQSLGGLLSPAILQFFAGVLVLVFVLANVLWFVERRSNPAFQNGYLRGLGEGLWGVMLIIATGEHGDRDVPNVVKRLMVASMWLLGVVLVAQFTATVTSSLTVQQLQTSIQGPGDLPGKTIATAPGSIAAQYLTQLGLPYVEITSGDQGYNMLAQGQVQAIVFEAPTLQWWAAQRGKGVIRVVGPVFRLEKYGIAMPEGSPLRKQINETLLELYRDGTYEDIHGKWFSEGK